VTYGNRRGGVRQPRQTRAWKARNSAGKCGICGEGVAEEQPMFFLTCLGREAVPGQQIERSTDSNPTGFRVRFTGWGELKDEQGNPVRDPETGKLKLTKQFQWQREGADGAWHDVLVWDHAVHTACAEARGYRTPGQKMKAAPGTRTKGVFMQVGAEEPPLTAIAREMIADEAALPEPPARVTEEPDPAGYDSDPNVQP
jgi:hypothetical protein